MHLRSAERLRDLCCANRGTFIKVGQHLGALDYLLPEEYTSTLKVLHSQAPQSSIEEIQQVIREDLGKEVSKNTFRVSFLFGCTHMWNIFTVDRLIPRNEEWFMVESPFTFRLTFLSLKVSLSHHSCPPAAPAGEGFSCADSLLEAEKSSAIFRSSTSVCSLRHVRHTQAPRFV